MSFQRSAATEKYLPISELYRYSDLCQTEEDMMRIRFITIGTCIITLFLLITSSCSHSRHAVDTDRLCPTGVSHDKLLMVEGCWFDDNSYRIRTTVAPSRKSVGLEEKKESAKRTAILMAGASFLNLINDQRLKIIYRGFPPDAYVNFTESNYPAKVFSSVAKNGTVLRETYDELQNCTIIYEIHEKNLRRKVADYLKSLE